MDRTEGAARPEQDETPASRTRPGPSELRRRYARTGLWWTSAVNVRIGAMVAWIAEPLGVSPNLVTAASLATSLVGAALLLLLPDPWTWPAAAVLFVVWQFSFGLDCADGLLARRLGRSTAYGAWLDQVADLLGHLAIFGALAASVAARLDLPALPAALFTVLVVGGNSVLGVAIGLRGTTVLRDTVAFDRPRLGLFARALHLVDYGLVLAICAALLLAPPILAIYLAGVAIASLLALAALAVLLGRRAAAEAIEADAGSGGK